MYKQHFQRFLANNDRLHFAAHSHHLWPDCTRNAVIQCWDDAAKYADAKWTFLYDSIIPEAQGHVVRLLKTGEPEQVVFAPNTHEFVVRLLSCCSLSKKPKILTSDSEFHSFSRQLGRLEELNLVDVTRIPSMPANSFIARVAEQAAADAFDLIFFSHVFFDSGLCVGDVQPVAVAASPQTMVVVDAYHSFAALPTEIEAIADRVFWMAGGYKYAQSGEGACWLRVPSTHTTNPRNTGWFAAFGNLAERTEGSIPFATDGGRFAGSTFDPTGLYRFNAVMRWLNQIELTIPLIHEYVVGLQRYFLEQLESLPSDWLCRDRLILESLDLHGHFLTFELPDGEAAAEIHRQLLERNVIVDYRANRLRFGFGIYQDESDIDALFERLRQVD